MSVSTPALSFDQVQMTGARFEKAVIFTGARWVWYSRAIFPIDPRMTYYVIAQGNEIIAYAGTDPVFKNAKPGQEEFSFINVRSDHRHHGHAKALAHAVFGRAAAGGKILKPTPFLDDGRKWLMHTLPRLHRGYPELKIIWGDGGAGAIDGRRPYMIDADRWNSNPVQFLPS